MNNVFLQPREIKWLRSNGSGHLRLALAATPLAADSQPHRMARIAKLSSDMNCYLVRHGDAVSAAENAERPLSRLGCEQAERAAREALERGIEIARIYHSGILRAKQTAEIFAKTLAPSVVVEQHAGLLPEDDPALVKAELDNAECPIMLVGHLPYLNRLAGLLISGDPERAVVSFLPATVLCCAKAEGRWKINWISGAPGT